MRETEQTTRVIFVRHGTTDFPKKRLYCDNDEQPPLSEAGLAQAFHAASVLKNEPLAAIYSSPILRAQHTANIIATSNGAAVTLDERLKERSMGQWDGRYFDDIQSNSPDEFLQWKKDPTTFVPPQGESMFDLLTRMRQALSEWLERHRGERIAVVCHVGPVRVAVCDALTIPLAAHRQLTVVNAAATCIDYGRHQNNLIYFNRV